MQERQTSSLAIETREQRRGAKVAPGRLRASLAKVGGQLLAIE